MKTQTRLLTAPTKSPRPYSSEFGGMLVELLLSVALAAIILPFVFRYQKTRIERAENIQITRQMENIQTALERYINFHKTELLAPVGKNITRVGIADLAPYGVPSETIEKFGQDYQLRILKSNDRNAQASLQGVIVLTSKDISPIRTREIISLGGETMGFVEQGKAFGSFGTWHSDAIDLGLAGLDGIVETTSVTRGNNQYLLRIPSENIADATMLSPLNLGGHNIIDVKFFDAAAARFNETLSARTITTSNLIFQNQTTIDKHFETKEAVVSGTLSSDSRNMEIGGTLSLSGTAKFSNITVENLWANNLYLSGLSISGLSEKPAVLKINQTINMVTGHIKAMFTSVGFTGSITPKLYIRDRIEDSIDGGYYWDVQTGIAHLSDVSILELNRMAAAAAYNERDEKTISGQLFNSVATNKNATAADFLNVLSEIQRGVRQKYRQLNLE